MTKMEAYVFTSAAVVFTIKPETNH